MLRLAILFLVAVAIQGSHGIGNWKREWVKKQLDKQIHNNTIFLVTSKRCSHSFYCKQDLDNWAVPYQSQDYDAMPPLETFYYLEALQEVVPRYMWTRLPKVFVCGKFIGDKNDIRMWHEYGWLDEAMEKCKDPGKNRPNSELNSD